MYFPITSSLELYRLLQASLSAMKSAATVDPILWRAGRTIDRAIRTKSFLHLSVA